MAGLLLWPHAVWVRRGPTACLRRCLGAAEHASAGAGCAASAMLPAQRPSAPSAAARWRRVVGRSLNVWLLDRSVVAPQAEPAGRGDAGGDGDARRWAGARCVYLARTLAAAASPLPTPSMHRVPVRMPPHLPLPSPALPYVPHVSYRRRVCAHQRRGVLDHARLLALGVRQDDGQQGAGGHLINKKKKRRAAPGRGTAAAAAPAARPACHRLGWEPQARS